MKSPEQALAELQKTMAQLAQAQEETLQQLDQIREAQGLTNKKLDHALPLLADVELRKAVQEELDGHLDNIRARNRKQVGRG